MMKKYAIGPATNPQIGAATTEAIAISNSFESCMRVTSFSLGNAVELGIGCFEATEYHILFEVW